MAFFQQWLQNKVQNGFKKDQTNRMIDKKGKCQFSESHTKILQVKIVKSSG